MSSQHGFLSYVFASLLVPVLSPVLDSISALTSLKGEAVPPDASDAMETVFADVERAVCQSCPSESTECSDGAVIVLEFAVTWIVEEPS
jgi:hypothetical protein